MPINQKSFYFTYEELKLILQQIHKIWIFSFYFTYEELKPQMRIPIFSAPRRVFTLPMRNWNTLCWIWEKSVALVFTLPMRNWNTSFPILYNFQCLVFTLPMRNWNIQDICPTTYHQFRFYFTYEELKPQKKGR